MSDIEFKRLEFSLLPHFSIGEENDPVSLWNLRKDITEIPWALPYNISNVLNYGT